MAVRCVLTLALLMLPGLSFAVNGLVGAWGLNGVIGTTQADYSGNNNRGTPTNGIDGLVPTTAGKFGSTLAFNGANTYVDLGNPAVLQITGSMTVSAWIRSAAFPVDDTAIVSKRTAGDAGYQLDTTVDGGPRTIGFKLASSTGATMKRLGATVLQLNQWYYVTGVYDGSAQTLSVYLNGNLDNGTLVGPVTATQLDSPVNVNIGRRAGASGYEFNGTIDEVRIYNRALTQAEIQADMNAAVAPPSPDTVAPTAPTNLAVSAMSTTQLHVQWTNSTDNFDVTGYRVERCQGAACTNFVEVATANDFKLNDSGLTPATTYRYRVRATDGAGNFSGYSNIATLATLTSNPTGGRVGAYPFEEGSGTTTGDFSGFGNNGTLNSSVSWTTAGKFGKALSFTSGYVDLGNPGTLQITGSVTISAWINSAAFPVDDAAIVSKLIISPGPGWQLDTTIDLGPRTVGFKLANPSGSLMARYGATTLQLNQWYHVAGVYDAQAQTLNVYLNGQLDNGTLVGTVTSSQLDALTNVNIGRRPDLNGYEFIGTIDEVRIYNRALTQAEIQADMNSGIAGGTDTTPPTAPTGLSAAAMSMSQINLSWTASTDNVMVAGYRVERCQGTGCSNFAQIATPTGTSFHDMGLAATTSYSYRVRAVDAAGNLSGYSNVASATTLGANAQIYYIHPDHLNTPRMIANQAGTAVWRWDQGEPFGNDVPNNNPSGAGAFDFPLRFPGQYFDRETNLAYNLIRDYDPSVGRYAESDPIGLRAGMNTYAYVSNKPLTAKDPRGLAKWTGTMNSLALLDYGQDEFELKSECKCGYKNSIHVTALYVSDPISAIASSSNIEFEDNFACPNPMAFAGPAFKVSAGFGVKYGVGFTFILLGAATSPGHFGPHEAWGVNFDVSVGYSWVGSIKSEACPCK